MTNCGSVSYVIDMDTNKNESVVSDGDTNGIWFHITIIVEAYKVSQGNKLREHDRICWEKVAGSVSTLCNLTYK